jgi:hypothetical protein
MFVTVLLVLGTSKSAKFTSALVLVKIAALSLFIVLTIGVANHANFTPLLPNGWGTPLSGTGVLGAAASIFFAYVGFDAVSTAAEETENPNRNIPIGLIGSLAICTVFYLLVAYCAIGSANGVGAAQPGSEFSQAKDPLAWILRSIDHPVAAKLVGGAAILALPSVVLMMIYGQTRILFTMARDGLMPSAFAKVHPTFHTPHVVHDDHRRGLRPVRGDVPGRRAGGHLQRRHPVRLLHGGAGRGDAAQVRPGPPPSLPHPDGVAGRPGGDGRLRAAVLQPGLEPDDQVLLHLGRGRPDRLLRLRPPQQRAGSGQRELPRRRCEAAPRFHEGPDPGP